MIEVHIPVMGASCVCKKGILRLESLTARDDMLVITLYCGECEEMYKVELGKIELLFEDDEEEES